ncbi:DUF6798 domain-containing protein [Thermoleptolyngbya sp. C42_A2020_037]|uniref:DUF6798 domain-containing protein n=1 Tax=Thermoleptolyngbya sp. C42_A2020_037 TaxID=2747799 RepID=UPI0019EC0692|nr:DUF6798 domain-containing protein [Thermoleptolyngbya sp. C42_A2020_037]MBF2083525.1 hypothetical protein [Thermoleptolyngbya sp. C42_A2020_037]
MSTLGKDFQREFGKQIRATLAAVAPLWLPVLLLVGLVSLRCLLVGNMGQVNETNILPFARQQVNPNWLPQDWYLNQPPGYRVPFIAIFGRMADAWGFLPTSIIGRLLGYTGLSAGLVFLSRRIGLSLPLLLLSMILFLYVNTGLSGASGAQGTVSREWLFGGIEPKIPAYTCILFALGLLLAGRIVLAGLLLGVATSFHTLVGGWAFLAAIAWLVLWRRDLLRNLGNVLKMLALYAVGAVFSIRPVLQQLTMQTPEGRFSESFVYVFIRTPHHLNPLSWDGGWWLKPVTLLAIALGSAILLHRIAQQRRQLHTPHHRARMGLTAFLLCSLIPFAAGLLAAPFDTEGEFLQYYPFRFGDIMLPLNACLLGCCALEQAMGRRSLSGSTGQAAKRLRRVSLWIVAAVCAAQSVVFVQQAIALQDFPSRAQRIDRDGKELCEWIQQNTPRDAIFVTPPVELDNFHWLAERATIAKFKLVPPASVGIPEWIDRLTRLSGSVDPWVGIQRDRNNSLDIQRRMTQGYRNLTTEQAIALMQTYSAAYFLSKGSPKLYLPILYQNEDYTLYAAPNPVAQPGN